MTPKIKIKYVNFNGNRRLRRQLCVIIFLGDKLKQDLPAVPKDMEGRLIKVYTIISHEITQRELPILVPRFRQFIAVDGHNSEHLLP